jgi:GNAT superfamily N-acetyltransferase
MSLKIIEADLDNPTHAEHILFLTNTYAMDEMGGGKPLADEVQENLVEGMKAMPTTLVFIALKDEKPVGIANCFLGYSTFFAKQLINIHDLGVIPDARGQGVGGILIEAVTQKAKDLDCCKVTLEVLENNPARRLYEREGFKYGDPQYFFMNKYLE